MTIDNGVSQGQIVPCPECDNEMKAQTKNEEDVFLPHVCPQCGYEFDWEARKEK